MTKNPEEIIAEFEERFVVEIDFPGIFALNNPLPEDVKSFLAESLAAYRLSVLSECENLVEDNSAAHFNGICSTCGPYNDKDMCYHDGKNAANALWRERIAELKKK